LAEGVVADRSGVLVTLDDPEARDFAAVDPTGFVEQNPDGLLVIDEIQRAPELIVAIKAAVDRDRGLADSSSPVRRTFLISPPRTSRWRDRRRAWCCTHSARASWSRGQGRSSMLCSAGLPPFVFRAPCDDATTWIALVPAAIPRRSRGESVRRRSDWYQTYVNRIVNRDAVDISGLQRLADLPRLLRL